MSFGNGSGSYVCTTPTLTTRSDGVDGARPGFASHACLVRWTPSPTKGQRGYLLRNRRMPPCGKVQFMCMKFLLRVLMPPMVPLTPDCRTHLLRNRRVRLWPWAGGQIMLVLRRMLPSPWVHLLRNRRMQPRVPLPADLEHHSGQTSHTCCTLLLVLCSAVRAAAILT